MLIERGAGVLPFLVHGATGDEVESGGPAEPGAEWWRFEGQPPVDPTHPAAGWVAHLLQEAAATPLPCPRCNAVNETWRTLDHLLRTHGADFAEAADWLEEADRDLFSLAVHYLASKARAGCRPGPSGPRATTGRCRR